MIICFHRFFSFSLVPAVGGLYGILVSRSGSAVGMGWQGLKKILIPASIALALWGLLTFTKKRKCRRSVNSIQYDKSQSLPSTENVKLQVVEHQQEPIRLEPRQKKYSISNDRANVVPNLQSHVTNKSNNEQQSNDNVTIDSKINTDDKATIKTKFDIEKSFDSVGHSERKDSSFLSDTVFHNHNEGLRASEVLDPALKDDFYPDSSNQKEEQDTFDPERRSNSLCDNKSNLINSEIRGEDLEAPYFKVLEQEKNAQQAKELVLPDHSSLSNTTVEEEKHWKHIENINSDDNVKDNLESDVNNEHHHSVISHQNAENYKTETSLNLNNEMGEHIKSVKVSDAKEVVEDEFCQSNSALDSSLATPFDHNSETTSAVSAVTPMNSDIVSDSDNCTAVDCKVEECSAEIHRDVLLDENNTEQSVSRNEKLHGMASKKCEDYSTLQHDDVDDMIDNSYDLKDNVNILNPNNGNVVADYVLKYSENSDNQNGQFNKDRFASNETQDRVTDDYNKKDNSVVFPDSAKTSSTENRENDLSHFDDGVRVQAIKNTGHYEIPFDNASSITENTTDRDTVHKNDNKPNDTVNSDEPYKNATVDGDFASQNKIALSKSNSGENVETVSAVLADINTKDLNNVDAKSEDVVNKMEYKPEEISPPNFIKTNDETHKSNTNNDGTDMNPANQRDLEDITSANHKDIEDINSSNPRDVGKDVSSVTADDKTTAILLVQTEIKSANVDDAKLEEDSYRSMKPATTLSTDSAESPFEVPHHSDLISSDAVDEGKDITKERHESNCSNVDKTKEESEPGKSKEDDNKASSTADDSDKINNQTSKPAGDASSNEKQDSPLSKKSDSVSGKEYIMLFLNHY